MLWSVRQWMWWREWVTMGDPWEATPSLGSGLVLCFLLLSWVDGAAWLCLPYYDEPESLKTMSPNKSLFL